MTGIPDPQEDHAVIMVKFAKDCMAKMSRLLQELAGTLGDDTLDLKMRVGIHSGSVTGGVLRGDKSRFQLFGSTMNTAARMESNGVRSFRCVFFPLSNTASKQFNSHDSTFQ